MSLTASQDGPAAAEKGKKLLQVDSRLTHHAICALYAVSHEDALLNSTNETSFQRSSRSSMMQLCRLPSKVTTLRIVGTLVLCKS